MDVRKAIAERRSIRKYKSQPVEKEKLDMVLDAMRLAPSAHNKQGWKFIAVSDKAVKEKVCHAAFDQEMLKSAPVILVACGVAPDRMSNGWEDAPVNLSIALSFGVLQATELGLGTCLATWFDQNSMKEALGLSENETAVMISPLGYPAETPDARPRKQTEEVIFYR